MNSQYRVLIIDDNREIHNDFLKILVSNNSLSTSLVEVEKFIFDEQENEKLELIYTVDSAYQGQEGFELIRQANEQGQPYALAFVDMRMPPGWDGLETIQHIYEIDKNIQVVICTAYSDYSLTEIIGRLGINDRLLILKKPFDNVEVRQLVYALIKKWQLNIDVHQKMGNLETLVAARTGELEKNVSIVEMILDASTDGILVLDKDKNIVYCSKKLVNMWDIPNMIIRSNHIDKLIEYIAGQLDNHKLFHENLKTLNPNTENHYMMELNLNDGKVFEWYYHLRSIREISYQIFCFRDISKRKVVEKKLTHQSTHDSLTDLPNRILLLDRLQQAITLAQHQEKNVIIFFLDLDRFKIVNDNLGHEIGDELLKTVAMRLITYVNHIDTVARLGGDEFVIVNTSLANEDQITAYAKGILKKLAEPFYCQDHELLSTCSIGISLYPQNGLSPDQLLKNADTAMYRAKIMGGNTYQVFIDEMNDQTLKRYDFEKNLRGALDKNEFYLHYQPQVDLKTGKIIGVEALIRWSHPILGLVPPLEFIPLAEETGLIIPISEWVLETACRQNKFWQDNGFPSMVMAVNISAEQFWHADIVDVVSLALERSGLAPQYLELELTESILMKNVQAALKAMNRLKGLGIKLAIDDFGTGYSSLSYLQQFPIDKIKIDRSFICYLNENSKDDAIVIAIISLAKSMKAKIIAEGVENESQWVFLEHHGCDEIQGFYFCRPLDENGCTRFLCLKANIPVIASKTAKIEEIH